MTYAIRLNAQGHITVLEPYQALEGQRPIQNSEVAIVLDYMKHNPNAPIKQELGKIKRWLKAHDYMVNKHTLGEYADNDTRWIDYLQERKAKLEQYNALEVQHVDKEPFDLTLLVQPIEEVQEVLDESQIDMDEVIEDVYDDTYEEYNDLEA